MENQDGLLTAEELASEFTFSVPDAQSTELKDVNIDLVGSIPEEEVPQATPPKKEEAAPVIPQLTPSQNTEYSVKAKTLIEVGEWEDAEIELEDGSTVKLSEYDGLDEEQYKELLKEQKKIRQEDIEKKYIKADDADENKKRLANIILKGGDLKEIFKTEEELVEPFSESIGWDLDNEQHQASILYQNFLAKGITEGDAADLVEKARKDLTLDIKAKQIVDYVRGQHSAKIKEAEVNLIKELKEEQERLKTYKVNLTKEYREQGLEDNLIKRLVDSATVKTENGDFHVDSLYEEKMKDPKEAKEIILFLQDREKYLALNMNKAELKANVETFRKIKLIPKGRDKNSPAAEGDEKSTSFKFELP